MLQTILIIFSALIAPTIADCSYSTLQEATSSYVASQTAGRTTNLTAVTTYTENFKPADITTGILAQPLKIDHIRSIHDTAACAAFTELIVADAQHPYVIGSQIRLTDGKITQIDSIVTHPGDWLFNATGTLYWSNQENWDPIPVEKRDTRETILKAANAYVNMFNDSSVVVPWGKPCARLEGGSYSGKGLPTDSCDLGPPPKTTLVTHSYVLDETFGTVDVFLNFGGSSGNVDSHQFRVQEGKIRYIHTMTVGIIPF